jgi:hypothetical protein
MARHSLVALLRFVPPSSASMTVRCLVTYRAVGWIAAYVLPHELLNFHFVFVSNLASGGIEAICAACVKASYRKNTTGNMREVFPARRSAPQKYVDEAWASDVYRAPRDGYRTLPTSCAETVSARLHGEKPAFRRTLIPLPHQLHCVRAPLAAIPRLLHHRETNLYNCPLAASFALHTSPS